MFKEAERLTAVPFEVDTVPLDNMWPEQPAGNATGPPGPSPDAREADNGLAAQAVRVTPTCPSTPKSANTRSPAATGSGTAAVPVITY